MNRSHRLAEERAAFREAYAEAQRREPTPAEEAMEAVLGDLCHERLILAYGAQWPLECRARGEILDFYVRGPNGYLCIEVDGPEHKKGPDARRDRRLMKEHGIATLRIKNRDILAEPAAVRLLIEEVLRGERA